MTRSSVGIATRPSARPTVFIVDDDAVTRESLQHLIESVQLRVRSFGSAEAFLEAYAGERPACLVVDLFMPGKTGLELQKEMKERGVALPVIVMTAHGDVPTAVRALRAGAMDFFEKPVGAQEFLERVREAIQLDGEARERDLHHEEIQRALSRLTPRELEILALVSDGKSSKEIAVQLDVSVNTVQNHRARIMHKMGATSVGALVRMFATVQSAS